MGNNTKGLGTVRHSTCSFLLTVCTVTHTAVRINAMYAARKKLFLCSFPLYTEHEIKSTGAKSTQILDFYGLYVNECCLFHTTILHTRHFCTSLNFCTNVACVYMVVYQCVRVRELAFINGFTYPSASNHEPSSNTLGRSKKRKKEETSIKCSKLFF